MSVKIWDKGFSVNEQVEKFTVGHDRELDLFLAKYDVLGSLAHTRMLQSIGLLTAEELEKIQTELKAIYHAAEAGKFEIEPDVEDFIHK